LCASKASCVIPQKFGVRGSQFAFWLCSDPDAAKQGVPLFEFTVRPSTTLDGTETWEVYYTTSTNGNQMFCIAIGYSNGGVSTLSSSSDEKLDVSSGPPSDTTADDGSRDMNHMTKLGSIWAKKSFINTRLFSMSVVCDGAGTIRPIPTMKTTSMRAAAVQSMSLQQQLVLAERMALPVPAVASSAMGTALGSDPVTRFRRKMWLRAASWKGKAHDIMDRFISDGYGTITGSYTVSSCPELSHNCRSTKCAVDAGNDASPRDV
jgi:hypothetical protein